MTAWRRMIRRLRAMPDGCVYASAIQTGCAVRMLDCACYVDDGYVARYAVRVGYAVRAQDMSDRRTCMHGCDGYVPMRCMCDRYAIVRDAARARDGQDLDMRCRMRSLLRAETEFVGYALRCAARLPDCG